MRQRLARLTLAALVAPLMLAGCGGAQRVAEPLDLTVSLAPSGAVVVTGLPANLWQRGHRLVVQGEPGEGHRALMIVTEVAGGTAQLAPLVERPGVRVAGRPIRSLAEGERPQLGKFHAALTERKARRVRLSRGAQDGVQVGDAHYAERDRPDRPLRSPPPGDQIGAKRRGAWVTCGRRPPGSSSTRPSG